MKRLLLESMMAHMWVKDFSKNIMQTTYSQKNDTVQKAAADYVASVLDESSQNVSLQRKANMANNAVQCAALPRPNNTGMPDNLKSGIESLSGFSMDNVRVHYNSSKPAAVQALAYTQGTDIHVAPGQEKCLPHEAWHVAQQMAGRVSPTTNINGMPVNDNAALEYEADVMGEKAESQKFEKIIHIDNSKSLSSCSVQRMPKLSELSDYGKLDSLEKPTLPLDCSDEDRNLLKNGSIIERKNPICGVDGSDNSSIKKVDALKAIAEEAGVLGQLPLNDSEYFYAIIPAIYTTRGLNSANSVREAQLKLKYNFRSTGVSRNGGLMSEAGGPGYIVEVSKSKKGGGVRTARMVVNGKNPIKEGEYSNVHEKKTTPSQSILADTYRKATDGRMAVGDFNGSVPDAYTKLAGEGARFCCVRNNIRAINDLTCFCYDGTSISFVNLYGIWGDVFGNRFNISDDEICVWLKQKSNVDSNFEAENKIDLMHGGIDALRGAFSPNKLEQSIKNKFTELQEKDDLINYHFFYGGNTVPVADFTNIDNLCKLLNPKHKIDFGSLANDPLSFVSEQLQKNNWSIVVQKLRSAKNITSNMTKEQKKNYNEELKKAPKDCHSWRYGSIDYIVLSWSK